MGNLIWHYTDANALIGMLRNREIWLTDWEYLNDRNEMLLGQKLVGQCIEETLQTIEINPINARILREFFAYEKSKCYVSCFSAAEDSVSQWISYGDRGNGYAIGFDSSTLQGIACPWHGYRLQTSWIESHNGSLLNVVYVDAEHGPNDPGTLNVSGYVRELLNVFLKDRGESNTPRFNALLALLKECVRFVKDKSFAHEQEYRFVQEFNNGGLIVDDVATEFFTPKKGVLVPRLKLNFSMINRTANKENTFRIIKKIMIGPSLNQDLAEKSLRRLLKIDRSFQDIEIVRSRVPFRDGL